MKQIETVAGKILIIEVPEDAYGFDIDLSSHISTPIIIFSKHRFIPLYKHGNFKILGKLSELSEEECKKFVIKLNNNIYHDYSTEWNGKRDIIHVYKETAKESLISLLQSNGIDTTKENELLIVEVL